jgi:hypothetical protein
MRDNYSKKFNLTDDTFIKELKALNTYLVKVMLDIMKFNENLSDSEINNQYKRLYTGLIDLYKTSRSLQKNYEATNYFPISRNSLFCSIVFTLMTINRHPILFSFGMCSTILLGITTISAYLTNQKRAHLIESLKSALFYRYVKALSPIKLENNDTQNKQLGDDPYEYFRNITRATPEISRCVYGYTIVNSKSFKKGSCGRSAIFRDFTNISQTKSFVLVDAPIEPLSQQYQYHL